MFIRKNMVKNIILQHWTGNLGELEVLSSDNVYRYAEWINSDYSLLRGNVLSDDFSPPCQKLYMFSKKYDEYDNVLMLDMDMFFTNKIYSDNINIFEVNPGIGLHDRITTRVFSDFQRKHPQHSNKEYPYLGGAIWLISREVREKFRNVFKLTECKRFSGSHDDEGIMHYLAIKANHKEKNYMSSEWCQGSYFPNPEKAYLLHIRTRIK